LIEVRLFGDLRRYAGDPASLSGVAIQVPAGESDTIGQVLAQMGIGPEELSNIFLNGRLLPRSAYPITLGYPLAAKVPLSPEGCMSTPVRSGDRLGLFPRNMGAVVV
jgi:hypothetical protein